MSFLEELKKKLDERRSSVTVVNRGVTPLSLLGIAFIVLKVMGQISWSWWWVLAPFWIPLILAILLCIFITFMVVKMTSKEVKNTEKKETPKKTTRTKKTKKNEGEGDKGENEKGS